MSFVATLFQPFIAFLGAYKWYILIAILLYLVLTIVFRHSRALITVVFGVCILIFVITHLGDVYVTLNGLMTQLGENSQIATEQYTDYVEKNILAAVASVSVIAPKASQPSDNNSNKSEPEKEKETYVAPTFVRQSQTGVGIVQYIPLVIVIGAAIFMVVVNKKGGKKK